MVQAPVRITLTPEQQALVREVSGKNIASLGIEPNKTGSGWLYAAGNNQFWVLKHADPESYRAARRRQKPRINPQYARFRLRVGKSRIHRFGVFALEPIPARRNVIDYTGELVNSVESCRRTRNARKKYVIKLDDFWRIDGAVGGSGAEFINHSCDPNIRYRVVRNQVVCQSIRPIAVGEELTADYRFPNKAPAIPCRCGSPQCRGTINVTDGGKSRARPEFGGGTSTQGSQRVGRASPSTPPRPCVVLPT